MLAGFLEFLVGIGRLRANTRGVSNEVAKVASTNKGFGSFEIIMLLLELCTNGFGEELDVVGSQRILFIVTVVLTASRLGLAEGPVLRRDLRLARTDSPGGVH